MESGRSRRLVKVPLIRKRTFGRVGAVLRGRNSTGGRYWNFDVEEAGD